MKMIYLLGIIVLGISYCANKVSIKTQIKKKSIPKTEEIKLTVTENSDALTGDVSGLSLKSTTKTVDLECSSVTTAIAANTNDGEITCTPKDAMSTVGEYALTASGEAKIGSVTISVDNNSAKVIIYADDDPNGGDDGDDGDGGDNGDNGDGDNSSSSFNKLSIFILLIALLF